MLLSILIRNLNESESLRQTLAALQRQRTSFLYEIVVVDNESDDDSVQVAAALGCKVVTLQRSQFSYGRALNFGIAHCSGSIIMALSAHVILLNEHFLEQVPGYFADDRVAALRFVQATSPRQVGESIVKGPLMMEYNDHKDFPALQWANLMINHCSAFRKSCWQQVPFDESLPDSEDKRWSLDIMQKGYSLLYRVPCFYVYNKPLNRELKIQSMVNAYHARLLVTGKKEKIFDTTYLFSMAMKLREQLAKLKAQMIIHSSVYKGLRSHYSKKSGKS